MSMRHIQDTHKKTEGASEFANLLLDALGRADGLSRGKIADIYESYVKRQMTVVENLMEVEAA